MGKTPDMETSLAARDCIGFGVRRTARALSQHYDSALAPAYLKGTQFSHMGEAVCAVAVPAA